MIQKDGVDVEMLPDDWMLITKLIVNTVSKLNCTHN